MGYIILKKEDWYKIIILGLIVVLGVFLNGGIYEFRGGSNKPYMYKVNKFTGNVQFCTISRCKDVPEAPDKDAPDKYKGVVWD